MTLRVTLPPALRLRARLPVNPAGPLAFSRRGDRLLVPTREATLVVDALHGQPLECWRRAHRGFACGLEDRAVVAGTARGYLELWRFGGARPGHSETRHEGLRLVCGSPDGARLFTAGEGPRVGAWRTATLEVRFWTIEQPAIDLAYHEGDDALAVAQPRSVLVLDGRSGRRRGAVRPPGRVTAVAWLGEQLAVGTRTGQLALYDRRLMPLRPSLALGLGPLWRLLPLREELVVESEGGMAVIESLGGQERLRWSGSFGLPGGTLAVHPGQQAIACAVPGGVALLELAPAAPTANVELLALYHPADAALCQPVLGALRRAGAHLLDVTPRRLVEALRRGVPCVLLYGPTGAWPHHDWQLDVARTRGSYVVPVILPGGLAPPSPLPAASYVCFHERVHDDDALTRVTRAVLGLPPTL